MSFGNTLGRGIGKLGALAVEGAVRGATGLGQFGADVVEGAQQGYDEKHAALLISREQAKVAREAKLKALRDAHTLAQNPGPMVVVAQPTKRAAKA